MLMIECFFFFFFIHGARGGGRKKGEKGRQGDGQCLSPFSEMTLQITRCTRIMSLFFSTNFPVDIPSLLFFLRTSTSSIP